MRTFKKRQSLVGPGMFRQWEDWKEGDVLVGELVGFSTDKYKKISLKVKVVDASFKDKSQDKYVGKELTINSCGSLQKAYEELKENDAIGTGLQFEYLGMTTVKSGTYKDEPRHDIKMDIVDLDDDGSESEVEDDI